MNKKNIYVLSLLAGAFLPAMAQTDNTSDGDAFAAQEIEVGANKNFSAHNPRLPPLLSPTRT